MRAAGSPNRLRRGRHRLDPSMPAEKLRRRRAAPSLSILTRIGKPRRRKKDQSPRGAKRKFTRGKEKVHRCKGRRRWGHLMATRSPEGGRARRQGGQGGAAVRPPPMLTVRWWWLEEEVGRGKEDWAAAAARAHRRRRAAGPPARERGAGQREIDRKSVV